jgi:uncharacterized protein (TIGR00290 family)
MEHPKKPKAWLSWSSGKDSAFALHEARKSAELDIVAILTTVNETYERVAMHAVREELLKEQARRLGLPLVRVRIPRDCTNEIYEARMRQMIERALKDGISRMIFGDLFLEDIRQYREKMLAPTGIAPVFPLWQRDTRELAYEMIRSGLKAVITCVDPRKLPREFAGREFNEKLLADLPEGVDPCGENGEFHTFVYSSPDFARAIDVGVGEVVEREGFVFADVKMISFLPDGPLRN